MVFQCMKCLGQAFISTFFKTGIFKGLVVVKETNQAKQMDEQVEYAGVEAYGRHDVVGISTIDDIAGVINDETCHQ